MTVTDALLGPLRAGDAARPVVTFYDDATGERVELSGLTFVNWVAKTANLLRDECDVEPGTTVALLLPAHWQTAAVLLGAWWCGAHVLASPDAAEVALADAPSLPAAGGAGLVVGLSLDAFGRALADLPAGAVDFATEVRVHGDHFAPDAPAPDDAPALGDATVAEVLAAARARAGDLGLTASDRVLSTVDWPVAASGGLVDGLLAVLAAGASLVQVRHADPADPARLDRKVESERCTVRL